MTAAVKMVAISDDVALRELLRTMEPRLRRRFLEIVGWLRERLTLGEIADLISTGRLVDAIAADVAKAGAALGETVGAVYLAAAREIAKELSEGMDVLVTIDQTNPRAIRALERTALRLGQEMTADVRGVVTEIVRDGLEHGRNPRVQARAFRSSIGLTPRQVQHVANYRRYLETLDRQALERELRDARHDRTVARAIRDGKPLTRAQVDKMVARYQKNYLAYRAETIARTEAIGALHAGAREGWVQAADAGTFSREDVLRSWRTGPLGRKSERRDFHRSIVGQVVGLDEPFVSGLGNRLMHPHDPDAPLSEVANCACRVITRLTRRKAS